MLDNYQVCSNIDNCLIQLIHNNRLAVATSYTHALNYQAAIHPHVYCFKNNEYINTYPVAIFMRSNHPLFTQIQQIVRMAIEGGLIERWEQKAQNAHSMNVRHFEIRQRTPLSFEQVLIPMAVLLLSAVIASAVLCLERYVFKMASARRSKYRKFWRWMEKLIDGRRNCLRNRWMGRAPLKLANNRTLRKN